MTFCRCEKKVFFFALSSSVDRSSPVPPTCGVVPCQSVRTPTSFIDLSLIRGSSLILFKSCK